MSSIYNKDMETTKLKHQREALERLIELRRNEKPELTIRYFDYQLLLEAYDDLKKQLDELKLKEQTHQD